MKKESKELLRKKGWTAEEINHAERVIEERSMHDKSKSMVFSNRLVYWAVIFLMIIGNFMISMLLIPFLLTLNTLALDVIIVVMGLGFGALFNLVIVDVSHIDKKHHLAAGIIIPVLAFVNLFFMVKASNALIDVFGLGIVRDSSISISVLYVIAFMIPFFYSVFSKKIDLSYKEVSDRESAKEVEKKY